MNKVMLLAGALTWTLGVTSFADAQISFSFGGRGYGGHGHHHYGPHLHIGPGHLHLDTGRYHLDYGGYRNYGYWPSYGSRYYTSPAYSYVYPQYNYVVPRYSYYPSAYGAYQEQYLPTPPLTVIAPVVSPPIASQPIAPVVATNRGKIQLILPDPEAEVTFDGVRVDNVGRVRSFDTPPLEPGHTYSYKVAARWTQNGMPVTDARVVEVIPGRTSVVDFTRPVGGELPAAPAKVQSRP